MRKMFLKVIFSWHEMLHTALPEKEFCQIKVDDAFRNNIEQLKELGSARYTIDEQTGNTVYDWEAYTLTGDEWREYMMYKEQKAKEAAEKEAKGET